MKTTTLLSLACLALIWGSPASATLGENAASVQADQIYLNATLQITSAGKYAVHELKIPSGTVVREYVAPAGTVFAVAWEGPSLPDLRQVLGPYFDQYEQAAKTQRAGPGARVVQLPGLVVQSGGHMRAFFGRAYVPQLLPQGVAAEEIK